MSLEVLGLEIFGMTVPGAARSSFWGACHCPLACGCCHLQSQQWDLLAEELLN